MHERCGRCKFSTLCLALGPAELKKEIYQCNSCHSFFFKGLRIYPPPPKIKWKCPVFRSVMYRRDDAARKTFCEDCAKERHEVRIKEDEEMWKEWKEWKGRAG